MRAHPKEKALLDSHTNEYIRGFQDEKGAIARVKMEKANAATVSTAATAAIKAYPASAKILLETPSSFRYNVVPNMRLLERLCIKNSKGRN